MQLNKSKPSGRHPVHLTSNFQADLNTLIAAWLAPEQNKATAAAAGHQRSSPVEVKRT